MKTLTTIVLLAIGSVAAFAQGEVKVQNTAGFEVSTNGGFIAPRTTGTLSTYYISALFMNGSAAPSLYVTNSGALFGIIGGGNFVSNNIATTPNQTFQIRTWSFLVGGALGADWTTLLNNINISNPLAPKTSTAGLVGLWFGQSTVGTVSPLDIVANPTGFVPALFGSGAGQVAGYQLNAITLVSVPEPSTLVLAGLGAASLLLFRRRKLA